MPGKGYVADDNPRWLHPVDHPPPAGEKIQMLNRHGVLCLRHWPKEGTKAMACWAPLLKLDKELRARLRQEGLLK